MVMSRCVCDISMWFHVDIGRVRGDIWASPPQTGLLISACYSENMYDVRTSTVLAHRETRIALRKMQELFFQFIVFEMQSASLD